MLYTIKYIQCNPHPALILNAFRGEALRAIREVPIRHPRFARAQDTGCILCPKYINRGKMNAWVLKFFIH